MLPAGQALPGACPVSPPTTDLAFDMNHSPEVPRLPRLPFIVIDVLCLATAAYVALTAPSPLAGGSLIAVVILVALGAIALAVPFIADYGQKTDAALADRQRQIAALAQSTAASAEQISIAAASLHDIGENVARSARAIEGLPQKLHEKIAEFNTRLSEASAADTEELEQELQTLRSAESDRLVNAIDQLAATARELSRVETQIQAHATRAADAIARELSRRATYAWLAPPCASVHAASAPPAVATTDGFVAANRFAVASSRSYVRGRAIPASVHVPFVHTAFATCRASDCTALCCALFEAA